MPRNGSGVFEKLAGTTAVANTTIQSSLFNSFADDIVADLNTDRPIVAGGTGASNAADAKVNLEVVTSATGSARLPTGTTAQRDTTPAAGYLRHNTTTGAFEGYGTSWVQFPTQAAVDLKANQAITLTAGTSLTGGGDLSANRAFDVAFASQAEAEAGTATDKALNALRVKQAIDALAPQTGVVLHRGTRVTAGSTAFSTNTTILNFGSRAVQSANNRISIRASLDFFISSGSSVVVGLFFDSEPSARMTRTFTSPTGGARYFGVQVELEYTVPDTNARTAYMKVTATGGSGTVQAASGYLEEIAS